MKKDTRKKCFTIIRLLLSRILFSLYCVLSVLAVTIYVSNEVYWLLLIPVVPLFLETIRAGKNWKKKQIEITAGPVKSVKINSRELVEDIKARGSTLTRMVGVKIPQSSSTLQELCIVLCSAVYQNYSKFKANMIFSQKRLLSNMMHLKTVPPMSLFHQNLNRLCRNFMKKFGKIKNYLAMVISSIQFRQQKEIKVGDYVTIMT